MRESVMVAAFRGDEQQLTVNRLCGRVGVDPSTGHRWRQAGKLDCFRMGSRWFVNREAWSRFLEKCNGGPTEALSCVEGARR